MRNMEDEEARMDRYQDWELGFRAGIKEVVGWLFDHSTAQEVDFPPKCLAWSMRYDYWQAKLKEWGIE